MKHLDLFSGIGGFALAVDTVWPNSEHIFCDNDKFCQAVLRKHWSESKIYGDIKQFRSNERFDILTGGFPCQPFSQAGRRKGTDDDRYLWPEMFRVIREVQPRWVIAENVAGLITWNEGMVLEQVCYDLETEGYEVQPFIIPAVSKNAPHRRDRVWIIGYSKHNGFNGAKNRESNQKGSNDNTQGKEQICKSEGTSSIRDNASNTKCEGHKREVNKKGSSARYNRGSQSWEANWLEVATELCRVDDGLPSELDGLKLSKAGHRNARLKALGNAIVPQVAIEIMKAIKVSEINY